MSLFIEDTFSIFLIMTVIIGGGAAFLAGRALASKWRPVWMPVFYMLLLGLALRFFHYALFNGDLLSAHYYLTDTLVLVAAALLGYRLTRVNQMVSQYPWLYQCWTIQLEGSAGRDLATHRRQSARGIAPRECVLPFPNASTCLRIRPRGGSTPRATRPQPT
jgi:hypothetical protein